MLKHLATNQCIEQENSHKHVQMVWNTDAKNNRCSKNKRCI